MWSVIIPLTTILEPKTPFISSQPSHSLSHTMALVANQRKVAGVTSRKKALIVFSGVLLVVAAFMEAVRDTNAPSSHLKNWMSDAVAADTTTDRPSSPNLPQRQRFQNKKQIILYLRSPGPWDAQKKRLCLQLFKNRRKDLYNDTCVGYQPSGGILPYGRPNVEKWPHPHNLTCIQQQQQQQSTQFSTPQNYTTAFSWQTRAPYAIILGVMKGGTQALNQYLAQHPWAVPRDKKRKMEDHFFDGNGFIQYPYGIPQDENQQRYGRHFQRKYAALFQDADRTQLVHPNAFVIDDTPWLITGGRRMIQSILCVVPWVKMLLVVRNPVDRVESQYRYLDQNRRLSQFSPMPDWDAWIDHDIRLLTESGVLQDWTKVDFEQFSGSPQEVEAWKRYTLRKDSSMQIVGKSLYAISLTQYFQAMDDYGKPRSDLLVIPSERMRSHTQEVYDQVLQHLQLPAANLSSDGDKHTTKGSSAPMPEAVRRKLETLFEPYNRRLYKMLGWEAVWDDAKKARL